MEEDEPAPSERDTRVMQIVFARLADTSEIAFWREHTL